MHVLRRAALCTFVTVLSLLFGRATGVIQIAELGSLRHWLGSLVQITFAELVLFIG